MTKLSIVLMTFNRPLDALNTINSIVSQSTKSFELVVSDNSENNELTDLINPLIGKDLLNFRYIKRATVLSPNSHFTQCLSEVESEYVCFFHDDDLMHSNFVGDVLAAIDRFPNAVAFGTNAIWDFKGVSKKSSFQSVFYYPGPISPKKLLKKYFSRHQLGIAPFPSYTYKTIAAKKFTFSQDDGKYGDVKWLAMMCGYGDVYWINKMMMTYKIHADSGGATESRRDRLKFMAFIKKNINSLGSGMLADYRHFFYKKNINSFRGDCSHSAAVMNAYLKRYGVIRWLRWDHLMQLIIKVITRIFVKYEKYLR